MLQADYGLHLFIVMLFESQQDDFAALGKRDTHGPRFGKRLENRKLFFGYNDLGGLPWHRLPSVETGESE